MSITFTDIRALEILDSRSRPTLAVSVTLADGTSAPAGVPSGASTGTGEAVELRDHDPGRYRGLGVLTAVGNVNDEIADAVKGRPFAGLADLDAALIDLGRDAEQVPARRERHRRGVHGRGPRPGRLPRRPALELPHPARRRPPAYRPRTSTSSTAACTPRTAWTSRSS